MSEKTKKIFKIVLVSVYAFLFLHIAIKYLKIPGFYIYNTKGFIVLMMFAVVLPTLAVVCMFLSKRSKIAKIFLAIYIVVELFFISSWLIDMYVGSKTNDIGEYPGVISKIETVSWLDSLGLFPKEISEKAHCSFFYYENRCTEYLIYDNLGKSTWVCMELEFLDNEVYEEEKERLMENWEIFRKRYLEGYKDDCIVREIREYNLYNFGGEYYNTYFAFNDARRVIRYSHWLPIDFFDLKA